MDVGGSCFRLLSRARLREHQAQVSQGTLWTPYPLNSAFINFVVVFPCSLFCLLFHFVISVFVVNYVITSDAEECNPWRIGLLFPRIKSWVAILYVKYDSWFCGGRDVDFVPFRMYYRMSQLGPLLPCSNMSYDWMIFNIRVHRCCMFLKDGDQWHVCLFVVLLPRIFGLRFLFGGAFHGFFRRRW